MSATESASSRYNGGAMIVCAGESLIDFVPQAAGALPLYQPVAGGSPFNCAIAAARLGADVAFLGAVSQDFFGDQIISRLTENRVRREMVTRVENPTTLAFVQKTADGAARYAFYTNGSADRSLTGEMVPQSLPDGALLQIGSISLIPDPESSALLRLAERECDAHLVALDPNIRTSLIANQDDYRRRLQRALASAAVLKSSDEDLHWIFPGADVTEAASRAMDAGVNLVVVTRGAQGSSVFTPAGRHDAPAAPTTVSDTIGAGDSFLAALLVWLDEHEMRRRDDLLRISEEEILDMQAFASRVAAVTCSRVGADPPRRSEL